MKLLAAALLVGASSLNAYADSPDTIPLDDACKLVKKQSPPVAPRALKPRIVVGPRRPRPLFKHDVPPEYELLCDEGAPVPLSALPPAPPALVSLPAVPFEELASVPPDFPALNVVPETFEEVLNGSGLVYFGPPWATPSQPSFDTPLAPVPEPAVWALLGAGLALAALKKNAVGR